MCSALGVFLTHEPLPVKGLRYPHIICGSLSPLTPEPDFSRPLPSNSLAGLTSSFRCPFRESGSSLKPSFFLLFSASEKKKYNYLELFDPWLSDVQL